jgi:SNF2 family DNA or RNA helicase
MYVWKDQWETWTGNPAIVLPSTKYDMSVIPYDTAVIVNYEKLRGTSKQQDVAKQLVAWKPEAVIIDEAHRMKDRKSLTAQALNLFLKVPVRIALTGTPATNKPWDVWSVLHWLFPKQYSSFWAFIKEYFEEEVIWIGGEPHRQPARFKRGMEKILQMNLDVNCVQRKRKEVMKWLPAEIEPTKVLLPPTKKQTEILNDLINYFEHKHVVTQTVLDNLIRVRQVCAAPAILDLKGTSPKLEWLQYYLADYPEKHVLVFSNSKKFLRYISENLKQKHAMICGDVSPKERVQIVNSFQKGEIPVLLLQTQACKEGLTLDTADVSIFLDTYPPAADYLQAKDRMVATLEERNKPKEIIHVMMQGTYDEKTFELVQNNISEAAIINDYKNYIEERRQTNGKQQS